jgi:tetratricopeptide (TPR) repeat protein
VSESYRLLGRILAAQGKYGEAVPLYRQAVEELQKHLEADDPRLGTAVHELARMLWRAGEKGEAQTTMARAVKLYSKAFQNPNVTVTTEDAATGETARPGCHDEWLLYQGEFAEAASGLRAAEERQRTKAVFAMDPTQMPPAELLAEAEAGLGHHAAARDAYLRAAADWEQLLSPNHPWAQQCRQKAATLESSLAN